MTQVTSAPASRPETGSGTAPAYWVCASALLLAHAVAAWLLRPPSLTPQSNDDGLYFLLGRSLRHFHYSDAHVVGAPIQAQYPPGYPAILAVAGAIFGDSLTVAHVATVLTSLTGLVLLFDIGRRLLGPVPALGLLAAMVLNSQFLTYASRLASEQPYFAASVAAIWALTALPDTGRRLWIAGALTLFAAMTRSIGIALVLGLLLLWLIERRYRAAAVFGFFALTIVGGWLLWTSMAPDQFYERSYVATVARGLKSNRSLLDLLWNRITGFVEVILVRAPLAGLNVPSVEGTNADNLAWLGLVYLLAAAGVVLLWRKARIIPLYFAVFLAVLCLYPFKLTRFYMPVLPFQLLAMLAGVVRIGQSWQPRVLKAALLAIPLAILVNSTVSAVREVNEATECRRLTTPTHPACFPAVGQAFLAATRFAADSLPADATVLTIKEAPFFYYTGHRVMHSQLPAVQARGRVMEFLRDRGFSYVLLSAYPGGAVIADELLPACGDLDLLLAAEPSTYLLRIRPPGDPSPDSSACKAIRHAILMRPETVRP